MLNETGFGAGGDSSGRTIGDVVLVGRSWFRMTSGEDEATPAPLSSTKTARIGIDRRRLGLERRMSDRRTSSAPIALPAPTEAQPVEWDADAEMPRRTVTVSWWLVGVAGAMLMASGAAATALVKVRSVPVPAPVAAAVPVQPAAPVTSPALPPAPVIIEQLAPSPAPPSEVAPAEVAAEAPAPVVRPAPAAPVVRPAPAAPVVRPAPAARTASPTAPAVAPARRAPVSPPKRPVQTAASTPTSQRSMVWVDPFAE